MKMARKKADPTRSSRHIGDTKGDPGLLESDTRERLGNDIGNHGCSRNVVDDDLFLLNQVTKYRVMCSGIPMCFDLSWNQASFVRALAPWLLP